MPALNKPARRFKIMLIHSRRRSIHCRAQDARRLDIRLWERDYYGLKACALKHNFLIFEDRKFNDVGKTVQRQYGGGALRYYEWAHIINATLDIGPDSIKALAEVANVNPSLSERGLLVNMRTGIESEIPVVPDVATDLLRAYSPFAIGVVGNSDYSKKTCRVLQARQAAGETRLTDFAVFTTGVNLDLSTIDSKATPDDLLMLEQSNSMPGYDTPIQAVAKGADFIVVGEENFSGGFPEHEVKAYRVAEWTARQMIALDAELS